MVKESILMTVYDRPAPLLLSTLYFLAMSDLSDTEIIVVNDGSTDPLDWVSGVLGGLNGRIVVMEPYEAFRIDGGFNNPAKAFNRALEEARGERIAVMSSDTLVPPRVLEAARSCYKDDQVYCPMVVDLASGNEYCGPHRVFPMPWFLYMSRDVAVRAGGWDENYLLGSCWEDNDFVGRVALETGKILCDWSSICWHYSHVQPAYREETAIQIANQRNRVYTMDKWTGIPFSTPDVLCFEMGRKTDEATGNLLLGFQDVKGIKKRVWERTNSPFVVPATLGA